MIENDDCIHVLIPKKKTLFENITLKVIKVSKAEEKRLIKEDNDSGNNDTKWEEKNLKVGKKTQDGKQSK